jgi:hypothetical protein
MEKRTHQHSSVPMQQEGRALELAATTRIVSVPVPDELNTTAARFVWSVGPTIAVLPGLFAAYEREQTAE